MPLGQPAFLSMGSKIGKLDVGDSGACGGEDSFTGIAF